MLGLLRLGLPLGFGFGFGLGLGSGLGPGVGSNPNPNPELCSCSLRLRRLRTAAPELALGRPHEPSTPGFVRLLLDGPRTLAQLILTRTSSPTLSRT